MVGKSVVTGALVSGAFLAAPAAAKTSLRRLAAISRDANITDATIDVTFVKIAHPHSLGNSRNHTTPLETAIFNVLNTLFSAETGGDQPFTNFAAEHVIIDPEVVPLAENGYHATIPFELLLSSVTGGDDGLLEIIQRNIMPTTHADSAGDDATRKEFSRLVQAEYEGFQFFESWDYRYRFDWAPMDLTAANQTLDGRLTLTFDTVPEDFGGGNDTERKFADTNSADADGVEEYESLVDALRTQLPKSYAFKALGLDEATGFVLREDNPVTSALGNAVTFTIQVAFGTDAFDADDSEASREKVNTMWRAISGLDGHAVEGQEFGQEIACRLQAALTETTDAWTDKWSVKVPSAAVCSAIGILDETTDETTDNPSSSARSVAVVSFLSTAAAAAALF